VTGPAGDGDAAATAPVSAERSGRWRSVPLWLYGAAFVLLLVSGYLQVKGNIRSRPALVTASIVVSGVAVVLAAASVVLSGRWRRPPVPEDPAA
jgi:hypothetical protein